MHALYCKHSSETPVKPVKFVSTENCKYTTKYIHMCVRPHVGLSSNPLSSTVDACLHTATADRQVTLAEQVEAAAMGSLTHIQDKHDTGRLPKGRGPSGEAAMQLVCMSKFMEYAFMLAHKS